MVGRQKHQRPDRPDGEQEVKLPRELGVQTNAAGDELRDASPNMPLHNE